VLAMGPLEPKLALYAQIVTTLQRQIDDGTYGPGAALPSESQLVATFGASRSTVVKALSILRQDGWIESQHGKGYFVRGRPSAARHSAPGYLASLVDADETVTTQVLSVEPVMAPARIASALGVRENTPVYQRQRRVMAEGGPVALSDAYVPVNIAVAVGLDKSEPVTGSLRRSVEGAARARVEYVTENITARLPEPAEAELLEMKPSAPVLWLLITAHAADDTPLLALDIRLPADRHDLEDTFSLPD
jgi:GntR family transcriptional regulator